MFALKFPALIHVNASIVIERDSSGKPSKVVNTITAAINDSSTEPHAINEAMPCGNRLTLSATSKNPINGNTGIRSANVFMLTISNDSEYQYQLCAYCDTS
jgi:hypothetical protein